MRNNLILIAVLSLSLWSCNNSRPSTNSTTSETVETKEKITLLGKEATIYTTAENTDKRLFLDSTKTFNKAVQPLETEVAIFVNSEKQFQEFLGIGGAITDAAAEVFSKLKPTSKCFF